MAIFNSYVELPEGNYQRVIIHHHSIMDHRPGEHPRTSGGGPARHHDAGARGGMGPAAVRDVFGQIERKSHGKTIEKPPILSMGE